METFILSVLLLAGQAGVFWYLYFEKDSFQMKEFFEYFGFLVEVIILTLLNSYVYQITEIKSFNTDSLGAKKVEQMISFIDRLLPKHV